MRKRLINIILGLIVSGGTGYGIYNYTGNDIVLENGEVIQNKEIPKHLTKIFKIRSIDKIKYITFHHTAGSKTQTVESIANDQIKRGFASFAYHFAIYEDGSVYVVNDIEKISWHDSGQNTNSIGIVFVGNYQNYELSDDAFDSAKRLTDAICRTIDIKGIRAHRDTSPTLCCGYYAYKKLKPLFY